MDKSIEIPFFKAFEFGGVVSNCIHYIREKYDLGYMPKGEHKNKLDDEWQNYYDVVLPKLILEETEAFDDSTIVYSESPLIDEIERNLNECQTDKQKERYIYSILKPFSEIGSVYCPMGSINSIKKEIKKCENEKKEWASMPADKILFDTAGNQSGTPKEQIEACDSFIDRYKNDIDRAYYINSQFYTIAFQQVNEKMSVENCLQLFIRTFVIFTNRLDALLLTYGIDLMRLQEESGIHLKSYRSIADVEAYIGSIELSQKYIDELPCLELGSSTNNNTINTNHNSMNYKLIVLNAHTEHLEQKTTYKSYFKREAQIAKRDNFVEFPDYFKGCQYILESYKNEIITKYNKRLTENDWVVASVKSGKGMKFGNELVTDQTDERIQDSLHRISEDKKHIKSRGYIDNSDYAFCLTETGQITNDIWSKNYERKLYWQDILNLERGVLEANDELCPKSTDNNVIPNVNPKRKTTNEKNVKPQRIINAEELRKYFRPQFKGMGNGNLNQFDTLISELETERIGKEFAQIALMIYVSSKLNDRKPKNFKAWYTIFCNCIGCEQKKFHPKDLRKPTESLSRLFSFLK